MPDILLSKKFQAALVGVAAVVLAEFVPGLQEAELVAVLTPIVAYIIGQGLADLGKEAQKERNRHG